MKTIDWIPSPNRHVRFAQRTLLGLRLIVRRARRRPFRIRLRAGDQWVSLHIAASRELRRAGEHHLESGMLEHIAGSLRPGDVVYDIGANIGLISLILALRPEGRACRFHAFEPEPRNFEQLNANVDLNDLAGRVSPHQLALGDREGEVELFVRGTAGEGRHSIAARRGSTDSIMVPVMPASQFATSENAFPDVIKIDVEGAEGYVLAGLDELVRTNAPREIFMELHNKGLEDRMPDGSGIREWLAERSYVPIWEQQRRSGVHCHYRFAP